MSITVRKRWCAPSLKTQRQRGAGLIETLIALLVLAIGLVNTVALQIGNVKANRQAYQWADALWLASDMADRIYAYNDVDNAADDADFNNIDITTTNAFSDPGCHQSGCSPSQKVQLAKWQWQQAFEQRLPSGYGKVRYRSGAKVYTITIMWDARGNGAYGTNCSGDPGIDLTCLILDVPL